MIILMRTYEENSVEILADIRAKDMCEGYAHTVIEYMSGYLYVTDTFAIADVNDKDIVAAAEALFRIERNIE